MKKLILAVGAAVAGGASLVGGLLVGSAGVGVGSADPGTVNTLNVVGEPYAKAVAILRAQGVKTTFGGSMGSDVPQAQCLVKSQKVTASHKMQLDLDCTAASQPQQPATSATSGTQGGSGTSGAADAGGARPTPGAPGVVTVVPTPVG